MKRFVQVCTFAAIVAGAPIPFVPAQQTPRTKGAVLILDNQRVIEGEIQRRGDLYVIRQATGETTIPSGKVLFVCTSLDEAYRLFQKQANLRDGDERLRLARWCLTNGLRKEALAEAKAALQLRPKHAESKQLVALLEGSLNDVAKTALPSEPAGQVPQTGAGSEIGGDCFALFTSKVQPILMNTCASCHAGDRSDKFVLTRASDVGGRHATQINLAAAIKQICFDQPAASPLLQKACVAHGGASTPPLHNREGPPFSTLQCWVELVASRYPQFKSHGAVAVEGFAQAVAKKMPAPPEARPLVADSQQIGPTAKSSDSPLGRPTGPEQSVVGKLGESPVPRIVPTTSFSDPTASNVPRQLAPAPVDHYTPASEFDPMIFNRMWHPKQK